MVGHQNTVMTNLHGMGNCLLDGNVKVSTKLALRVTPDFQDVGTISRLIHAYPLLMLGGPVYFVRCARPPKRSVCGHSLPQEQEPSLK